jgi:hypothetical protein
MRVNKYTQIPQIMTGQIISPARPVFAAAAVASAGVASRGATATTTYLELTTGSNSVGRSRGTTAAAAVAAAVTNGTLFGFTPNSGSIRPRKAKQYIQFIH